MKLQYRLSLASARSTLARSNMERTMNLIQSVPAHLQADPAKRPGQIVNPLPPSKAYKPSHGGYPTPAPFSTDLSRR